MTLDEIFAALNQHVTEAAGDSEKLKAIANQLHTAVQPVAQALIDRGAGKKGGELQARLKALEAERDEAKRELGEVTQEFDEFKKKTPDAATIEANVQKRWEPRLKTAEERAKTTEEKYRGSRKRTTRGEFVRELIRLNVDPDYANEVLGAKYDDRFVPRDDSDDVDVLPLGGTDPIEAPAGQTAVGLLATAVRKTVPSRYVLADVDEGGGRRGGGEGGGGNGAGLRVVTEQKAASGTYAF